MDAGEDSRLAHGDLLLRFSEAATRWDADALSRINPEVTQAIGESGLVDAAGVVANFQRATRIADSAGIELDDPAETA